MHGGEIFIPKMPSFRIIDLASAINKSKPIKIIGIRPGEKIHEIMCSADESHATYEFNDHYIIYPTITFDNLNLQYYKKRVTQGGKLVKRNFEYTSQNNKNYLTIKEIEKKTK